MNLHTFIHAAEVILNYADCFCLSVSNCDYKLP
jgi:hypothetical protein